MALHRKILWALIAVLFAFDHPVSLFAETPSDTGPQFVSPKKKKKDDEEEVKEISGKTRSLTLSMGISRTLEYPFNVGPIYVTDPNLFDFRRVKEGDKDRKLLFVPKNAGTTDMTIHDSAGVPKITYRVLVTREDLGQIMSQLEELIGDVEGIRIRSVGGTILIDGDILLPKDMIRIMRVIDAIKERDPKKKEVPIKNIATISKTTMNIISERIEKEIGSPEITVKALNNNIIMEGVAASEYEADRALEIARLYLPEVFVERTKGEGGEVKPKANGGSAGGMPMILDLLQVQPRPAGAPSQDIKVTMNYVELNNEYEKLFNFQWKPLASDNSSVKYDSSLGEFSANVVATISSLFPKLITAKTHGHAKVLKTETIIVKDKSDQPAVIESSIDMYSRNVNDRGEASLQAIPIQNVTKVKAASIPGTDSIDLGIQITLNSLLGTNGSAPIVAKNSIQTQVTVKNGDSAALGGYGIDNAVAGYNRTPPTGSGGGQNSNSGSTPLINLERSKQYQRNKQQYVIFVTPEIIKTAANATEDITRKFKMNGGER